MELTFLIRFSYKMFYCNDYNDSTIYFQLHSSKNYDSS